MVCAVSPLFLLHSSLLLSLLSSPLTSLSSSNTTYALESSKILFYRFFFKNIVLFWHTLRGDGTKLQLITVADRHNNLQSQLAKRWKAIWILLYRKTLSLPCVWWVWLCVSVSVPQCQIPGPSDVTIWNETFLLMIHTGLGNGSRGVPTLSLCTMCWARLSSG